MIKANDIQVGGTHYQSGGMQHWDVAAELYGEAHFKCTATKYLFRWRSKNGVEDLEKARHYLIKLKELVNEGYVALSPSSREFVKHTCERMKCEDAEDWALMCRIFAAMDMPELEDCISDLDRRIRACKP